MIGLDPITTATEPNRQETVRLAIDHLDTSIGHAADRLNSILNQTMSGETAAIISECIGQLDNLRLREIVNLRTFLNTHSVKQEGNNHG